MEEETKSIVIHLNSNGWSASLWKRILKDTYWEYAADKETLYLTDGENLLQIIPKERYGILEQEVNIQIMVHNVLVHEFIFVKETINGLAK